MLIGRDRELCVLETAYKNDEFEFAVIYRRSSHTIIGYRYMVGFR